MRSAQPTLGLICLVALGGCGSTDIFEPASAYPPDPWVKGYSNPEDCLGGEDLAAIEFALPDYPKRAFRTGRQGWTIVRLDVSELGATENVRIERSVPDGMFDKASARAVEAWQFQPPEKGGLRDCRVLLRYQMGKVTLGG